MGAVKLVTILMFWFILGVLWASLYEYINTTIPAANTTAITNSGDTWTTILWVWNIGCVILAIGGAFVLINDGNIGGIIALDCTILSTWLITIIVWAYLYEPINITMPTAMGTTPNQYLGFWNNGAIFIVLSMALISLLGMGSISFSRSGRPKERIHVQRETIYRNAPQYESRTTYHYPRRAKLGKP